MILDESGSVGSYANDVRRAFRAFTSALNNTGSAIAVAEFSTVARLPLSHVRLHGRHRRHREPPCSSPTSRPATTRVAPRTGRTRCASGATSSRARTPSRTSWCSSPTATRTRSSARTGSPTTPATPSVALNEYERKVPLADERGRVREREPRQEPRGAQRQRDEGRGLARARRRRRRRPQQPGLAAAHHRRLRSGRVHRAAGRSTSRPRTSTGCADFSDLEDAMREAAFQLCAPSITVRKLVDYTPDPDTDDAIPGEDWDLTTTASPTPARWVLPATGAGGTATAPTGRQRVRRLPVDDRRTDRLECADRRGEPGQRPTRLRLRPRRRRACTYRTPGQPGDQPLPVIADRQRLHHDRHRRVDRHLPDGQPGGARSVDRDREVHQR